MNMDIDVALGIAGAVAVLGLSAVGSALGTGKAASAAIGAWKKCFAQNKKADFSILAFVGFPLSQTLYGMILMSSMKSLIEGSLIVHGAGIGMLIVGIFAGLGIAASAIFQGIAAAGASNAFAETGKGKTLYIGALGIVETVAILTMVFAMLTVSSFKKDEASAEKAPVAIEQVVEVAE